jgi:hypothetical protein
MPILYGEEPKRKSQTEAVLKETLRKIQTEKMLRNKTLEIQGEIFRQAVGEQSPVFANPKLRKRTW